MKSTEDNGLPKTLPEYGIVWKDTPAFSVVCKELMGWFIVPEPGEKRVWGIYDLPSRKLDVAYDMAVTGPASVHGLDGVSIVGLPQEKVRRETAERCTIFQREGGHVTADDPRIVRLEERHLPLLEGLFDHPDVTQYQRDVYSSAYETILRAADTEELKCDVFGFLSDGRLLAAIQVSTTNYATISFQRTMLINPFTRPDHRGKGCSKALMNHVLGLYPGQTVAYEYDGENEAAAKLAAACGFLPVLNIDLYTLDLL